MLEVIVDAYGRQNRVHIARNTGLSDSEIEIATADLRKSRLSERAGFTLIFE